MSLSSPEETCSFLLTLEALEKQPYGYENANLASCLSCAFIQKFKPVPLFCLTVTVPGFFGSVTVELPKTSAQKLAKDAYPYLVWAPLLKRLTLHLASAAGKLTIQAKALP